MEDDRAATSVPAYLDHPPAEATLPPHLQRLENRFLRRQTAREVAERVSHAVAVSSLVVGECALQQSRTPSLDGSCEPGNLDYVYADGSCADGGRHVDCGLFETDSK